MTKRMFTVLAMMALAVAQSLPAQDVVTEELISLTGPTKVTCDDDGNTKSGKAGHSWAWGDDVMLKVGAGIRASYRAMEGANQGPRTGSMRQDFNVDNARIYMSGQGHDRIGFEFNTDINNAQGFDFAESLVGNGFGSAESGEMRVLDAILKFKLGCNHHFWIGRFLPPSDRANLSGPFYQNAWTFPWVQFGYANIFQGRDDGAALWGQYDDGRLKWAVGVFEGESDGGLFAIGHPATDNLMFTARVVLNLLDPEPGYYNASTYYGEKDILAIGASVMNRHDALSDGAGGESDYTSWNLDLLFETVMASGGVATFESAYYNTTDNGGTGPNGTITNPVTGGSRAGESYFLLGSYLLARNSCVLGYEGKWQGMARFQHYSHDDIGDIEQYDLQMNYIMKGHNARTSAVFSELDNGQSKSYAFTLGGQLQF